MKRLDISKLQKNRSRHFKLGLVIALSMVIYAFNWTSKPPVFQEFDLEPEAFIDTEVIRTKHEKKPIPIPPKMKAVEQIIQEKQPDFIEEPIEDKKPTKTDAKPSEKIFKSEKDRGPALKIELPEPEIEAPPFFKFVEEMPRFSGCEEDGLSKEEKKQCAEQMLYAFMSKNLNYPAMARENGIEGMAFIRFIVEKDGSISNAEIVRDPGAGCGKEALRVVKSMPNWLPGKQRGKPVRVQFNLPVRFKLH